MSLFRDENGILTPSGYLAMFLVFVFLGIALFALLSFIDNHTYFAYKIDQGSFGTSDKCWTVALVGRYCEVNGEEIEVIEYEEVLK